MKIGKKLMKHNIIPITEEDILNNKSCKANENFTSVTIKRPTLKEAKETDYRTLCLLVGSLGLKFRPLKGSVENANYWLKNKTKEELLDLFKYEFV
ncbi:hypothetical protein HMPREF9019_0948 [Hoylesella timonensis CRIS 5C-B1]|uniref:Uncharacterized protein n=2 Tax=Hoylesella timonensis TaxID=386414 RepID=D1VXK9_9BACT|nr:hypothetical protein HMPREF9019_0948 [Hoylesella timonensis CRIS 5C-B1]